MEMSKACLPPRQPYISEEERKHPRFNEYMRYRNGMSMQLVQACSFKNWLRQTEDYERPKVAVFQVKPWTVPECDRPEGWLSPGWYKHVFAPRHQLTDRFGPFKTKEEADAS